MMHSLESKSLCFYTTILLFISLCLMHEAEGYPNLGKHVLQVKKSQESITDKQRDGEPVKSRCSGCSSLKEGSEEYKYYIEKVKAEILSKLNMKSAPKPKITRNSIPSPIFSGELLGESSEDDFTGRGDGYHGLTKQIILVNEQGKNYCGVGTCIRFRLKQKLFGEGEIKSVQLWLYRSDIRGKLSTLQLFEVGRETDGVFKPRSKFLMASRVHSVNRGWFAIDLTRFQSWIQVPTKGHNTVDVILRILCNGCDIANTGGNAPFLVINTNTNRVSRRRRSVDCHSGQKGCCRERVFVNFTTIGWNDWIIAPIGYDANNCRGTCDFFSVPIYGHTSVMRRIGKQIKSCCTTKRLSSISLLYYDDAGYIFKKNIPNMSVEECGCTS